MAVGIGRTADKGFPHSALTTEEDAMSALATG